MTKLAIIGGSGLTQLNTLQVTHRRILHTPFGAPSAPLLFGLVHDRRVVFLARHGSVHSIPPHKVNYRANLWALKEVGVEQVVGVAAVGGISSPMKPGFVVIPDQIIDYTYGRKHTFFEEDLSQVTHIDFTEPYCDRLRQALIVAAGTAGVVAAPKGTYGATQGPRLETAMEINRMERDGCDLVGMTGMPEATLARELDLCYASCAVVANQAAGRNDGPITMTEIEANLVEGIERVLRLLAILICNFKPD